MDCALLKTQFNGFYAISCRHIAKPPAIFVCQHCAEEWAKENLFNDYKVVPLGFDIKLSGNFPNNSFSVIKSSDSNYTSALGALDKHELVERT